MHHLSVTIPDLLYQQLEALSQDMNFKVSDLVRTFLREGIDNQRSIETDKSGSPNRQKRMDGYSIRTYCLVEEAMQSLVTEGRQLSEKSHLKAENIIKSLQ